MTRHGPLGGVREREALLHRAGGGDAHQRRPEAVLRRLVHVEVLGDPGGEVRVERRLSQQTDQGRLVRDHRSGEAVLGDGVVGAEAAEIGHHQLEVLPEDEAPPELLVRVQLGALGGDHVHPGVAARRPLVDGHVLEEGLLGVAAALVVLLVLGAVEIGGGRPPAIVRVLVVVPGGDDRPAGMDLLEQRIAPVGAVEVAVVAHAPRREVPTPEVDGLGRLAERDCPGAHRDSVRSGGLVDVVPDGEEEVELVGLEGEHLLVAVPEPAHVVLAVGDREPDRHVGGRLGGGPGPAGGGVVARRPLHEAEPVVVGAPGREPLHPDLDAAVVGSGGGEVVLLHHQLEEVGLGRDLQPQREVHRGAPDVHHPGPKDDRVLLRIARGHALGEAGEPVGVAPGALARFAGRERRRGGHHGDGLQDRPTVETVHGLPLRTTRTGIVARHDSRVSQERGCTSMAPGV